MTTKKTWKKHFRNAKQDLAKANEVNDKLRLFGKEQSEHIHAQEAEIDMLRSTWTPPQDGPGDGRGEDAADLSLNVEAARSFGKTIPGTATPAPNWKD